VCPELGVVGGHPNMDTSTDLTYIARWKMTIIERMQHQVSTLVRNDVELSIQLKNRAKIVQNNRELTQLVSSVY